MKTTIRNAEQSAPAGEREAFDKWFRGEQLIADHIDTTFISEAFLPYKAFKAGAAWQRTQAAGVSEGWREDVFLAAQMLTWGDADGWLTERQITEIEQHAKKLFDMLAAAPSQPASDKGEVQRLREALEHARLFIRNGIDLGYIRMPDADTPDPAHETLPMIDDALAASTGQEV